MFIHDSGQSNPVQTPPPGLHNLSVAVTILYYFYYHFFIVVAAAAAAAVVVVLFHLLSFLLS